MKLVSCSTCSRFPVWFSDALLLPPPPPPLRSQLLKFDLATLSFYLQMDVQRRSSSSSSCLQGGQWNHLMVPPEWKACVIGCHYISHTTTKETPSLDRFTKPGFQQIWKEKVHCSFKCKLRICQRKCSRIFFLYIVDMPGCERLPCVCVRWNWQLLKF